MTATQDLIVRHSPEQIDSSKDPEKTTPEKAFSSSHTTVTAPPTSQDRQLVSHTAATAIQQKTIECLANPDNLQMELDQAVVPLFASHQPLDNEQQTNKHQTSKVKTWKRVGLKEGRLQRNHITSQLQQGTTTSERQREDKAPTKV
ncbi:RNA-binding (RRM/RBD/RNP motifs) family protein [Striga asiatica]|uniref:RNA-binding (RRM/RBD/RNP motifs) family protein n=1 Tax=Striga asiatica TaxID=4170 RepID=A0A5A7P6L4_STRAF|nr:RNA-binding (RRM/RBD/RNP motifs) family protein [Striga asiatica]